MMKKERRLCEVAKRHPYNDLAAFDEELLLFEEQDDQRSLLKKMHKLQRMKSYVQFLVFCAGVIAGVVFSGGELQAQTPGNPFATPYQYLDNKYVPSGILHNRSPYYRYCFSYDTVAMAQLPDTTWKPNPYFFQGGHISNSRPVFMKLYKDMLFAQVNDSVIINPVDYSGHYDLARQQYDVPVSLMALDFQRMHEDGLATGKVWFDTVTGAFFPMPDTLWLPDTVITPDTMMIASLPQYLVFHNPDSLLALAFTSHKIFAAAVPEVDHFVPGSTITLRYGIPAGIFISNTGILPQVLIDFDDGGGYRNVDWDTPVDVSYNFPSMTTPAVIGLKIRIPSLDPDLVLYQSIKVITHAVGPDTVIFTDGLPFICEPSISATPASSRLSVVYADKNLRRLTRPVVFIEGFETSMRDFGDVNYQNLVNGLMPDKGFPELGEMPAVFDTLLVNGFDLIYIDFINSRDTIERNVLAVIKALQWVIDDLRMAGSVEKIIVSGASLGGVMARFALRQMEMDGCCHNTRLYISFDAPHRGANMPMGVQKLVEVAAAESAGWKSVAWPLSWILKFKDLEIDLSDPDVEETWAKVLNSPAARELLIQHIDPTAWSVHQKFYEYLDDIGLPNYCRNIALISGSENAWQLTLEDPAQRIMGTGRMQSLPYAWDVLVPGTNCLSPVHWYPFNSKLFPVAFSQAYAESEPSYFEYNDWGKSVANMNEILRIAAYHSLINTGLGIAGMACLSTNPWVSLFMEASIIANKLEGNDCLHLFHNQASVMNSCPSGTLMNLTCAPGGLNNSIKKLGSAADGLIKVYSSEFSFIPSVSALNVKGLGLLPDLKFLYLMDARSLTPFDAYWAPKRHELSDSRQNQLHVEVGQWNRQWIRDHVLLEYDLKADDGTYAGVLNTSYNFGKPGLFFDINHHNRPHHTVLYSLEVMGGAALHVNRYGEIGFPGSYDMTQPGSNFHLFTNGDSCDPTYVRVHDGGELVLGDQNNGNRAQLFFRPNTTLELMPGSLLKLSDNCRLVMESGSALVIHPGAQIILDGNGAVLEMCGRLVLEDLAVFTWSGNGYLKYNTQMTAMTADDYFSIGSKATLQLQGTSNKDQRLYIATDTWFPFNLDLDMEDALVTLGENRNLHIYGPVSADNVWFRTEDTAVFYGSVTVYGQSATSVKNCVFSHGSIGMKGLLGLGGSGLNLTGCLFRKNINGLFTSDERVSLYECRFIENAHQGWQAENMAGKSLVEDCWFLNNGYAGVVFDGQLSSSLLVRRSYLKFNFIGAEVRHAMLQAHCAHFSENTYAGILGGNMAQLELSGMLKNQISDNYIGLLLDKALVVNLENGFARFSGNQYYVIGEVLPNKYFNLSTNSIKSLIFSGNHMPWTGNLLPVNVYLTHPQTQVICQVGIIANTQVSHLQTTCNSTAMDNDHIVKPLQVLCGASLVSGGRYNNYLLVDALSIAAGMVSCDGFQGNDTLAIRAFVDILQHAPPILNEDERSGIDYALRLLSSALSNAIEKGEIDPNRAVEGMPLNEFVESIAARVQEQINSVDPSGYFAEEDEARYALMMAQMYRVAEHYDYALNILSDDRQFGNTSLTNTAAYWSCVCMAEKLLLLDSIDRGRFVQMLDSCNSTANARKAPFIPIPGCFFRENVHEERKIVLNVYPNPASRHVVVELDLPAESFRAEVADISGRKVMEAHQTYTDRDVVLKLPDLRPGIYTLQVIVDGVVSMHKLSVNQ
jgi:hypothetical protein